MSKKAQKKKKKKKKIKDTVKQEIRESIKENDEIEELGLEERVQNITDITKSILVIKRYKEIIRKQRKKCKICWDAGPIIKENPRERKSFLNTCSKQVHSLI